MKVFLNSRYNLVKFSIHEISQILKNKIFMIHAGRKCFSVSYEKSQKPNFLVSKGKFYQLIQKYKKDELEAFCLNRRFENKNFLHKILFTQKKSYFFFLAIICASWLFFEVAACFLFFLFLLFLGLKLIVIIKSIYFFKVNSFSVTQGVSTKDPRYSVLVPLYKEAHILPQIIASLRALCVNKKNVEFLIVLESDDLQTQARLRDLPLDDSFVVIVVPNFKPKTKPKALNYAINFATGDYICVYDAEDIPDPNQLELAEKTFQLGNADVLQAVLSFYNHKQNLMTLCFNFEYVSWFYFLFSGYSAAGFNCPLGGTSNHIKKEALIRSGYWNSFNVTEDLELSIALSKRGFTIRFLDSFTQEQCVFRLKDWFLQRKRWMKGYYISYFENFFTFSIFDFKNFVYFHGIVGFSAVSFLVVPFLYLYVKNIHPNSSLLAKNIYILGLVSNIFSVIFFVACILFPIALVSIKLKIKNVINISKIFASYPCYFVLHFVCSIFALFEAVSFPSIWSKTTHSLTKQAFYDSNAGLQR